MPQVAQDATRVGPTITSPFKHKLTLRVLSQPICTVLMLQTAPTTSYVHDASRDRHTYLLAELVGEGDEYPPVSLALVGREGEDAGQVVPEVRVLLLAEVPYRVEAKAVHLRERETPKHTFYQTPVNTKRAKSAFTVCIQ